MRVLIFYTSFSETFLIQEEMSEIWSKMYIDSVRFEWNLNIPDW
jgi:hypothetical protein